MFKTKDEYQDYYIIDTGEILLGSERDDFKLTKVVEPFNLVTTFRVVYSPKSRIEILPAEDVSMGDAKEALRQAMSDSDRPYVTDIAKAIVSNG